MTVKKSQLNFFAFSFEGEIHYGFSQEALNQMLHARKRNFIQYEDGSVDCARCYEKALTVKIIVPLYYLIWASEDLEYRVVFSKKIYAFHHDYCPDCDILPQYEYQAVIQVKESLEAYVR